MTFQRHLFNPREAMLKLADPTFQKRTLYCALISCSTCNTRELKIYRQFHYCNSLGPKNKIKKKVLVGNFDSKWLLYPHEVYDQVSKAEQDAIKKCGDFEFEDAAAVIRRSPLPQEIKDQMPEDPAFSLGLVFYASTTATDITTRQHWKYTMAMDRFLAHFNQAKFSAEFGASRQGITRDVYENMYRLYQLDTLIQHIDRHEDKPMPVLTQRCGRGSTVKKSLPKKVEEDEQDEEEDGEEDEEGEEEDADNSEWEDEEEEEEEEEEDEQEEKEDKNTDDHDNDNDDDEEEDEDEQEFIDGEPCIGWSLYFPFTDDLTNDGEEYKAQEVLHICHDSDEVRGLINPGVDICNFFEFPILLARHYWYRARVCEHYGDVVTRETPKGISHKLLKWQVTDEAAKQLSHERTAEQN
ncbi:hypothetical protein CPC16_002852 [Podila verticillata]|nr:hypothetical protein CPC16_002852 [Podila verticillata]